MLTFLVGGSGLEGGRVLGLGEMLQRRDLRIEVGQVLLDHICKLGNFHGPVVKYGLSLSDCLRVRSDQQ